MEGGDRFEAAGFDEREREVREQESEGKVGNNGESEKKRGGGRRFSRAP